MSPGRALGTCRDAAALTGVIWGIQQHSPPRLGSHHYPLLTQTKDLPTTGVKLPSGTCGMGQPPRVLLTKPLASLSSLLLAPSAKKQRELKARQPTNSTFQQQQLLHHAWDSEGLSKSVLPNLCLPQLLRARGEARIASALSESCPVSWDGEVV